MLRSAFAVVAIWVASPAMTGLAQAPGDSGAETAELRPGRYWVRRVHGEGAVRIEPSRHPRPRLVVTTGRTRCVAVTVEGGGAWRSLLMGSHRSGELEIRLRRREAGWSLVHPRLLRSDPIMDLHGTCREPWTVRPPEDDMVTWTSAGPLFGNEAACEGESLEFVRHCRGADCEYVPPLAQPFELGTCEAAFHRLKRQAAFLGGASHAQRLRTVRRLDRMTREGGRLWLFDAANQRCRAASVRPEPQNRVRLTASYRRPHSRIHEEAVYELEPLSGFATRFSYSSTEKADGGGMGTFGGGGSTRVRLHLGAGVIHLDQQWLFLRRATCQTHGAQLA